MFSSLFQKTNQEDMKALIARGAVIIDVRTREEFEEGHCAQAYNVPLQEIDTIGKYVKDMATPVITCCRSGGRSSMALQLLKSQGYKEVYNGGGWESLAAKIA